MNRNVQKSRGATSVQLFFCSLFCVVNLTIIPRSLAGIDGFVESFDGTGGFESTNGLLQGLDNPDWTLFGEAQFESGGVFMETVPNEPGQEGVIVSLFRDVMGTGSFITKVRFANTALQSDSSGSASIGINHWFDLALDNPNNPRANFAVSNSIHDPEEWTLGILVGFQGKEVVVPAANNVIELSLAFDIDSSTTTFMYDDNPEDLVDAREIGSIVYDGVVSDTQISEVFVTAFRGFSQTNVQFMSLTGVMDESLGDFNNNGRLDSEDIELLSADIRSKNPSQVFDVNSDGIVDGFDRNVWVHDLANTFFGDSNLDGEFNSNDLVAIFQAGEYEDNIEDNSTWATGDWDGNAEFNSRDLVIAFQDDGYEAGPRATGLSVPAPTTALPLIAVGLLTFHRYRRNSTQV